MRAKRSRSRAIAEPSESRGPGSIPEYRSKERDDERRTRKPMLFWDRIKILLLLVGAWLLLLWSTIASYPAGYLPLSDALPINLQNNGWLLLLAGAELIRQIHYLISERWARYHAFWTDRVFGGVERRAARMYDWTRFRIARIAKVLFWLVIIDLVIAQLFDLSPATALFELPALVIEGLPFILRLSFGFFFVIVQFVGIFWFLSRGGVDVYFPDDIKTRFTDVWGQDNVVGKVKENMVFLEDPESIERKGGYVPGGTLLWGPPGTGKTLIAEAVAGETGKPFVFVDPGAFINMFMGVGILKVKGLFRKLRKLAVRYGGVIVFFDEADSLGSRGVIAQQGGWGQRAVPGHTGMMSSCNGMAYLSPDTATMLFHSELASGAVERRGPVWDRIMVGGMGGGNMGTLQALLTELSGLKKPRGFFNRIVRRALGMRPKPPPRYRILVMMATNMPQALDEALLRPGRIDRIYKVGYPSKPGRVRTYEGYLAKVKHALGDEEVDKLATITPYATGATIKDTVNEALINAIRDGRDTIVWKDIIKAKQLKDLGPPEDVEYIERERHAVAVHEACHAVVAYRVRKHLTIDIATIEKGGTYLGLVASIPPEDQFTRWKSEYEADIMVSIASLAGERIFFDGDSSSGVSGDLEGATKIATMMEGFWGMGSTVASHGVTHEVGIGGGGKPGQGEQKKDKDLLQTDLGQRIEAKLGELLERTIQLIEANRTEILAVAHALETNKTVTGEDVEAIIEGRQGPLIDGRPYQAHVFAEMAEEYHTQVITAHKAHSKVPLKLPMPEGMSAPGSPLEDEVATTAVDGDESARKDVSGNGARARGKTRRGLFGSRRAKADE
jgi:cell division protease FtsH